MKNTLVCCKIQLRLSKFNILAHVLLTWNVTYK